MTDIAALSSAFSPIIALLALFFSLYHDYWRGPIIRCSAIRQIMLANLNNASGVYLPLVFTNSGSNTGTIEMVAVVLEKMQSNSNCDKQIYVPYIDNFNFHEFRERKEFPEAIENPFHEFAVSPNASIIKNILFACHADFRFNKGTYEVKIFYKLSIDDKYKKGVSKTIKIDHDFGINAWQASTDPFGTSEIRFPQESLY